MRKFILFLVYLCFLHVLINENANAQSSVSTNISLSPEFPVESSLSPPIDLYTAVTIKTVSPVNSQFQGRIQNIFDNDPATLVRPASDRLPWPGAKPLEITLEAKDLLTISGAGVLPYYDAYMSMELAVSLEDLKDHGRSYVKLFDRETLKGGSWFRKELGKEYKVYVARITLYSQDELYPAALAEWALMGNIYRPNANDLSVGYIKRLPEIDYVENSNWPEREGWPKENSEIIWRAYVKNWSDIGRRGVSYSWWLNNRKIASGKVNLKPHAFTYVDLPAEWNFNRKQLTFRIDDQNVIEEVSEDNNSVSIFTDAISLNVYVEKSLYEYFHRYQRSIKDPVTTNSFEDWLQIRHVRRWNRMFNDAKYELALNGVLDRIRVDSIVIVPDHALPLHGGEPTNDPNALDRTVDLQWGFPSKESFFNDFYSDTLTASDDNPFFFEGSLLHELGHARYLIDNYGFDVQDSVPLTEEGVPVSGSKYLPYISGQYTYISPHQGLMHHTYDYIDRYSTYALNRIAGHRATQGNRNAPGNIGVFMHRDLPEHNILILKDKNGNLLRNARLDVYQNQDIRGESQKPYEKRFGSSPALTFLTDQQGRVDVSRNPFNKDDTFNSPAYGVILLRVEADCEVGYQFIDVTRFNIAFWEGHTETAEYTLEFRTFRQADCGSCTAGFSQFRKIGGSGESRYSGIVQDSLGNTYAAGAFEGVADFGGIQANSADDFFDAYLVKYNRQGNVSWLQTGGGAGGQSFSSVGNDRQGNIYVTGQFSRQASFDSIHFSSSSPYNVMLLKYNSYGQLLWGRQSYGTGDSYVDAAATTDKDGNTYLAGIYSRGVQFGNVHISPQVNTEYLHLFIVKFDSAGQAVWGRSYDNIYRGDITVSSIGVDESGISLAGNFRRMYSFGNGTIESAAASYDIFVARFDLAGRNQWAERAGGDGFEALNRMTVDPQGHLYITGRFSGTAQFGNIALVARSLYTDLFIARYTPGGAVLWALGGGGQDADIGYDVALGENGRLYAVGSVSQYFDLGVFNMHCEQYSCSYMAEVDAASGNVLGVQTVGFEVTRVSTGMNGVHIGGIYYNDFYIDTANISNDGNWDCFTARWCPQDGSAAPLDNDKAALKAGIIPVTGDGVGVYPNPGSGTFKVALENGGKISSIRVADLTGRTVFEQRQINGLLGDNEVWLDLTQHPDNMYVIYVQTKENIYNKKVLLRRDR